MDEITYKKRKLLLPNQAGTRAYSFELAKKIGMNEALLLQQIHYWLTYKQHLHDGRYWCHNTGDEWANQLMVSRRTFVRVLGRLREMGFLLVRNDLSYKKLDRTNWYSINYEKLNDDYGSELTISRAAIAPELQTTSASNGAIAPNWAAPLRQNGLLHCAKLTLPIPKIPAMIDAGVVLANASAFAKETASEEERTGEGTDAMKSTGSTNRTPEDWVDLSSGSPTTLSTVN